VRWQVGEAFGADCLHDTFADGRNGKAAQKGFPVRKWTATAHSDDKAGTAAVEGAACVVAVLSLESFHAACVVVGAAAMRILRRPPRLRQDHNLQLIMRMFEDCPFFVNMVPHRRAALLL
jgi:hypothetical protein